MSHPDLQELRGQINKQAKRGRMKKVVFSLLMVMAVIGGLSFYQELEGLITDSKVLYSNSVTFFKNVISDVKHMKGQAMVVGENDIRLDPLPEQILLVEAKGANIRSEASLEADVVIVVGHKSALVYLNEWSQEKDIYWLRVKTSDGTHGWISDRIVSWEKDSVKKVEEDAEGGNVASMKELGARYENGIGVEESLKESFSWYKRAADAGEHESQFIVGWFYQYGKGDVEQDHEEAFNYYHLSAVQGNEHAMNNLGYMYAFGLGVEENGPLAVQWLEQSAEYENADAIGNLAVLYLQGRDGVKRDLKKGIALMEQAAALGDQDAEQVLEVYQSVSEEEFIQRIDSRD